MWTSCRIEIQISGDGGGGVRAVPISPAFTHVKGREPRVRSSQPRLHMGMARAALQNHGTESLETGPRRLKVVGKLPGGLQWEC